MVMFISISFTNLEVFSQNAQGEGSGDYPPPAQNDWIITLDTEVLNENITIAGNITIKEGAKLTLDNVTLLINASNYGDSRITIQSGGELNIINNSRIMEGETKVNYDFIFENGSRGLIQKSTIKNCGWNDEGTWQSTGGILIMSDNVIIENSTIQNNYIGCVVVSSSPIIRYNVITDNLKYGILLLNGSAEIIGNDIAFTPVGVYSLYSDFTLSNNVIRDNGDAVSISYSNVYIYGGNISSNDRDDCTTGTCSSQETGKGLSIFYSNVSLEGVEVSENSDDGLIASLSTLDIQNSTFADNLNGISGEHTEIHLKNNIFSNNQGYGIHWRYSSLEADDSNTFAQNNGEGRIILEWDVNINVIDAYGDWVSNADIEFQGNGTTYHTMSFMGGGRRFISEYIITSDGSLIDHNPYTITAKKTAPWDGVEYSNSTEMEIRKNTMINITLPLKKSDLTVEKISFSDDPRIGKKLKINVEIANVGEAIANDVQVIITEKDSFGKTSIVNKTNVSVNPGQSLELRISWIPEQEGETQITADIKTSYDEKDNDNNELEIMVSVLEKELPLYEEPYFIAALMSIILILVGVGIYILALGKKKDEI